MKPERPTRLLASGAFPAFGAGTLLLLCSCVGPVQTPVALSLPVRMSPPPPPRLPPSTDWHDMPVTTGVWRWAQERSLSIARFGSPEQAALLSLTCDQLGRTVTITRSGTPTASNMSILTTSSSRIVPIHIDADGAAAATLPSRDPLLDAIAFSHGRFAVEMPGATPLFLPSWPEVSRVVEDCR